MTIENYAVEAELNRSRVYIEVRDLIFMSRHVSCAFTQALLLEKLMVQFGAQPVLTACDSALEHITLSVPRRMCILIALQYVSVNSSPGRAPQYAERVKHLVSPVYLSASINAFSINVIAAIHSNRADIAVKVLLDGFDWLRSNSTQQGGQLNVAAAFACTQFGRAELALQFSFFGYSNAYNSEDEPAIDLAKFHLLSASRISAGSLPSLGSMFSQETSRVEAGQLDLGQLINFHLPVYTASYELSSDVPDLKRVESLLAFAKELDGAIDSNCRGTWELGNALLQLHRGKTSLAREGLERAELFQTRINASLEPLRKELRKGLGLRPGFSGIQWTPASENAWKALQQCADLQSTSAEI